MYSIRRRLTLVLACGLVAVIVGAGAAATSILGAEAQSAFDAALIGRARALAALTEQEAGQIEFDYKPELLPEFEREAAPDYFQFWLDDGTMLLRSARLQVDLPRPGAKPGAPGDVVLPDGRPGRLARLAFVPPPPGGAWDPEDGIELAGAGGAAAPRGLLLAVAADRSALDASLAAVHRTVLGASAGAVLLALLLVWHALARGLRPLAEIARQVRELESPAGRARVEVAGEPIELLPVVRQLNALLARQAASVARERRFAGNVAHELRTPITELRALAAVGVRWPDDEDAVVGYFRDVHGIADRMESVIRDLALLARCQAGVEATDRSPLALAAAVTGAWSCLAAEAAAKAAVLRLAADEQLHVDSDPGKLHILLQNLLANAVAHAPAQAEIHCTLAGAGGRFRLEIENPAEPLDRDDLDRLTEPFWRKEESRTSAEHAGLGLALVAALAELLGLEVSFAQGPDHVFRARVEGPVRALAALPAATLPAATLPAATLPAAALPAAGAPPRLKTSVGERP